MKNRPTLEDLLALRDSEPVAAEVTATLESDLDAQHRLARLREIKGALRRLPDHLQARAEQWDEIQQSQAKKTEPHHESRTFAWPLALVATALIVAATLLIQPLTQDDGVELSRGNLAALQDRSRVLEGELMSPSRYRGSASEQALLFRLADVDSQLLAASQNGSVASMHQKELLWQRRVELMEVLRVVQQPVEPSPQYAVY